MHDHSINICFAVFIEGVEEYPVIGQHDKYSIKESILWSCSYIIYIIRVVQVLI